MGSHRTQHDRREPPGRAQPDCSRPGPTQAHKLRRPLHPPHTQPHASLDTRKQRAPRKPTAIPRGSTGVPRPPRMLGVHAHAAAPSLAATTHGRRPITAANGPPGALPAPSARRRPRVSAAAERHLRQRQRRGQARVGGGWCGREAGGSQWPPRRRRVEKKAVQSVRCACACASGAPRLSGRGGRMHGRHRRRWLRRWPWGSDGSARRRQPALRCVCCTCRGSEAVRSGQSAEGAKAQKARKGRAGGRRRTSFAPFRCP